MPPAAPAQKRKNPAPVIFLLHFFEFVLYYYSNRSQGRSTG